MITSLRQCTKPVRSGLTRPEDAGRAWEILGAKNLVAMHWGTFQLTDEPVFEPPVRLRAWFDERGHAKDRMWIVDIGETRSLAR